MFEKKLGGAKTFFRKKLGGRRLFLLKNFKIQDFIFQKKAKTFFQENFSQNPA